MERFYGCLAVFLTSSIIIGHGGMAWVLKTQDASEHILDVGRQNSFMVKRMCKVLHPKFPLSFKFY